MKARRDTNTADLFSLPVVVDNFEIPAFLRRAPDPEPGPAPPPPENPLLGRAKEAIRARARLSQDQATILGSISVVQKKLGIKYTEAAVLLRDLVQAGWITEADPSGERRILETP